MRRLLPVLPSASAAAPSERRVAERQADQGQTAALQHPAFGTTGGLELRGVGFEVGGTPLLRDVSCVAPPSTVTALIGPNGAGKSTLLRVAAAVVRPAHGSVHFGGADLHRLRARARARVVALVEQRPSTDLDLTVTQVVELGRIPHLPRLAAPGPHDHAAVERALHTAGVTELAERRYLTLSGGERQRVHIASALAQEPRLLLLDEPTNHLDVGAQLEILQLLPMLAGQGVTVVTALHDLSHAAAISDQVLLLDGGRRAAYGPPETALDPALLDQVYQVRTHVLPHPETGRPTFVYSPLG